MPDRSDPTYLRAVSGAAGVGAGTVVWTWAGELPVYRRRLVRLSAAAVTVLWPGPGTAGPVAWRAAAAGLGPGEVDPPAAAPDPIRPEFAAAPSAAVPVGPVPASGPTPNPAPAAVHAEAVAGGRRRIAVLAAAALLSWVVLPAVSRGLQHRWLSRLERAGHLHPHRALALRLGLFAFAVQLPGQLARVRRAARPALGHGG